jgi:hypothetical protein
VGVWLGQHRQLGIGSLLTATLESGLGGCDFETRKRDISAYAGHDSFFVAKNARSGEPQVEELRLGKVRSLWNRLGGVSNLGFAVWVVYGILYALGHWTAAVVAGLAIMLAIVARETLTANAKVVDLTSLGFFVLALIILSVLGDQVFNRYHIVLVWGVFAVATLATILIDFPFTVQLVWESAQREVWSEPFHRVHLRITTILGIIFALDTILAVVALGGSHVMMLSEIIPGASMIFGFAFSRIYLARYRSRFGESAGHSSMS